MSFKSCSALVLVFCCILTGCIAYAPDLMTPAAASAAVVDTTPQVMLVAAHAPGPLPDPEPSPQAATAPVVSDTPMPAQMAMNSTVLPVTPPSRPPPAPAPVATAADIGVLSTRLRSALGGTLLPDAPPLTRAALAAAQAMMARAHVAPDRLQVVLVVDRSPQVQRLWVTVATPGIDSLQSLGSVHVSTGKPGRKEHFRTPVGVFINDVDILGYRAQGTYNENHIRGIGVRGMRVWDFGWQTTDDWRTPHALMAVRMEMHATDPDVLEPRLGRWDSEGCVRIPSRFNSFLDQSGLIDAKDWAAAQDDRRFAALLPKHVVPNPLAGQTLVVIDTSDPGAAPSDPVKANLIEHPVNSGPEHDAD